MEHRPSRTNLTIIVRETTVWAGFAGRAYYLWLLVLSFCVCVCMLARGEHVFVSKKRIGIKSLPRSIFGLQNVSPKEKIHKYILFFSKLVCRQSRLVGCNQYLLSGKQWHIIYLQETIPVFMYELNMPRRHRWRLHICNWSARKDWHTTVNSIQTWLPQIEKWMLPLFEEEGGGKAKRGIDREGISAPRAGHRAQRWFFLYIKAFWERGQRL